MSDLVTPFDPVIDTIAIGTNEDEPDVWAVLRSEATREQAVAAVAKTEEVDLRLLTVEPRVERWTWGDPADYRGRLRKVWHIEKRPKERDLAIAHDRPTAAAYEAACAAIETHRARADAAEAQVVTLLPLVTHGAFEHRGEPCSICEVVGDGSDLSKAADAYRARIASEAARGAAGEALFSLAFAGAGREHLDHGAEPFSSLAGCPDIICRSRAEVLQDAITAGIATMRPDDEWLLDSHPWPEMEADPSFTEGMARVEADPGFEPVQHLDSHPFNEGPTDD